MGLRVLVIDDGIPAEIEEWSGAFTMAEVHSTSLATAMQLLRQQAFDLLLMPVRTRDELVSLGHAVRAVGLEQLAIVAFGVEDQIGIAPACSEADVEAYFNIEDSNADYALWTFEHAIETRRAKLDAARWRRLQRQQESSEHHEAVQQLRIQRSAILEFVSEDASRERIAESEMGQVPEWLIERFEQMIKARAMSGSSRDRDLVTLIDCLQKSGLPLLDCLLANSLASERIMLGLGQRPGWFVLGQSQVLAYQLSLSFCGEHVSSTG